MIVKEKPTHLMGKSSKTSNTSEFHFLSLKSGIISNLEFSMQNVPLFHQPQWVYNNYTLYRNRCWEELLIDYFIEFL